MKSAFLKLGLATVVLSVIIALSGCASDNPPINQVPTNDQVRFNGIEADSINIITDSQTGCKYIYVNSNKGTNEETATMSPLYINSNTVDCGQGGK